MKGSAGAAHPNQHRWNGWKSRSEPCGSCRDGELNVSEESGSILFYSLIKVPLPVSVFFSVASSLLSIQSPCPQIPSYSIPALLSDTGPMTTLLGNEVATHPLPCRSVHLAAETSHACPWLTASCVQPVDLTLEPEGTFISCIARDKVGIVCATSEVSCLVVASA
eukprot:752194-Hanusia_phi.AAC.1